VIKEAFVSQWSPINPGVTSNPEASACLLGHVPGPPRGTRSGWSARHNQCHRKGDSTRQRPWRTRDAGSRRTHDGRSDYS